jgi:hypothetical protein
MHVFEQVLSGGIRDADRVEARSRVLQGGSKHARIEPRPNRSRNEPVRSAVLKGRAFPISREIPKTGDSPWF